MGDPITARTRFRLRHFTNAGIVVGGVVGIWSTLFLFLPPELCFIVSGGVMFGVYKTMLEKRAIGVTCPHCNRYISSKTPWVCGFCKHRVHHVETHPFVHQCNDCSAEPKAYRCHHSECGKLIFLTEDRLEAGYARCAATPEELPKPPDNEDVEHTKAKQKIDHEITLTKMTADLNAAKRHLEMTEKKSPVDKLEQSYSEHEANVMAAYRIAKREKALNEQRYAGDPDMLKMANEAVDDWLKQRM